MGGTDPCLWPGFAGAWQHQEFTLWLSAIFRKRTGLFLARVAEAWQWRLLGADTVVAAFAALVTGKAADC
ncbi:hypothetical protein AB0K15_36685 [Amycolatopsis sp. NPDC049253]|uniref:hypothetical protein n=1 Tax=Amycolatopsis sp. NPDC049253 TaxID=3155274 RepID=UPI00343079EF